MAKPESGAPLTLAAFYILLALADGERHGYAVMQEVDRLTSGRFRLGPGTLYTTLHRLLGERLIDQAGKRPHSSEDPRRRYYRLTALGRRVARAEADRLEGLLRIAKDKRLTGRLVES